MKHLYVELAVVVVVVVGVEDPDVGSGRSYIYYRYVNRVDFMINRAHRCGS